MCPACIASAALMVAGVMSTGGLTALAAKLLHSKNSAERLSSGEPKERRSDHGYGDEQEGRSESRVASGMA
jgi:hypothetical protein